MAPLTQTPIRRKPSKPAHGVGFGASRGQTLRIELTDFNSPRFGSRFVFGVFCLFLFTGNLLVASPFAAFHGLLFACVAVLMALRPPIFPNPALWWALALAFLVFSSAVFLPAGWFPIPDWRGKLEELGVDTGSMVAIQARQSAEALVFFGILLLTGLWLAGHRASPAQIRTWALAFTVGVACYALLARVLHESLQARVGISADHFGLFPNRNHTATYLAMGGICGLGCTLQALRDKRFVTSFLAIAATSICLWAIASWSISRAGVVLVAIGGLLWVVLLGRRYLGLQGLWALALLAITPIGLFLIVNTKVKERIAQTVESANTSVTAETGQDPPDLTSVIATNQELFRLPVFLDTADLIRGHPWTGIGAGQFRYVFPQYRSLTITANDAAALHPESDWLWMAAETGVPATLALLALLIAACCYSIRRIRAGRDRALRAGCLVAAMLVPIHGLFDVPGHRITLAWSAMFLFVLSLHLPSSAAIAPAVPRPWPSRLLALGLLVSSFLLIRAQWFGGPQPATTSASLAIDRARQLHREDVALMTAAEAAGREHQPDPADDKLEQALAILAQARILTPLDRDLLLHQAFFALQFDDKYDLVDRSFAIARTLDPTWVEGALRQAQAWADIDPEKTADLWAEALRRARAIDALDPENRRSSAKTMEWIRSLVRKYPDLEAHLPRQAQ
jgi:O-antigen ligase